jgi:RND family efflux transporter MFP subunit
MYKYNTKKYNDMKNPGILLVCLAILCFTVSSCKNKGDGTNDKVGDLNDSTYVNEDKQEVSVMLLRYGDFSKEIISNGRLAAVRKADLYFRSMERVKTIHVKNGDRVKQGDLIAELDGFILSNALKQSQSLYEKAMIDFQDVLISQGYNINDTANIPVNAVRTARIKSGFDQAEADLELAEYNFRASVLKAPFSGVVADLYCTENNISSQTEKFCTIIDDSRFEAVFPVLEDELASVRKEQTVRIIPYSGSETEVKGMITQINPVVDENGMVKVYAACGNHNHNLYEGMNVKVVLEERLAGQLVIPKQALVLRSGKQVVFTYSAGKAKWVYVKTGLENISSYTVTEGLQAGDTLIYEGNLNLAHDAGVVINEGMKE